MLAPKSIDTKTQQRLNDVRRTLWMGAMKGLCLGTTLGVSSYFFSQHRNFMKVKMTRNGAVMATAGFACIGSYLGAVVYGSNAFACLADVMKRGPSLDPSVAAAEVSSASHDCAITCFESNVFGFV
jgi:hypothetical protein